MGKKTDTEWAVEQREILEFLCLYLDRVEWEYGECRAPFLYPPVFKKNNWFFRKSYICIIRDDSTVQSVLKIKGNNPRDLVSQVKEATSKRYGDILHILKHEKTADSYSSPE